MLYSVCNLKKTLYKGDFIMDVSAHAPLKVRCKTLFAKYRHLLLLLYLPIYLIWFSYVESTVTTRFHVIHVALDDYIPFCEYFIIPYLLWFAYVAFGVIYMAFNNRTDYYKLCAFLFTGMTVFLIISTLYPNGHFLRPAYFDHHNLCTRLCEMLYATDTPTNLFPSIHVYNSIGVHLAISHNEKLKKNKTFQFLSFVLMVSIILATMFLKQHSVFDVCTAFLLAYVMYLLVYRRVFSVSSETEKSGRSLSVEQ